MDASKIEKLKVIELKAELQARNLDIKGVKAVLIERLKDAIEKGTPVLDLKASSEISDTVEAIPASQKKTRRRSQTKSPSPVKKPPMESVLETLTEEKMEPEKKEDIIEDNKNIEVEESELKITNKQPKDEIETEKATEETLNIENEVEMKDAQNQENGNKDLEDETICKNIELGWETEDKCDDSESKEHHSSRKRSHRSRSAQSKSSRSRSRSARRSPAKNADDFTNEEDEPVVEENQIGLSWFDSDLHLLIDPVSFTSAKPMSEPIFDLVWSGARTNYGVKEGKVCFEVRISEERSLSSHFKDEPFVRGLRCGFSTTDSSLLIGESPTSYAYCENGKKAVNGDFVEYGKPFGLDDVIGCYIDLDNSPCTIQYTLNGETLGTAFEFVKSSVLGDEGEKALFPHVLTKGYEFQVNFADNENLLGNVEPPKRGKKEQKKNEEPETKKNKPDEQSTNGSENDKKDVSHEEGGDNINFKNEKMDKNEGTNEELNTREEAIKTTEEIEEKEEFSPKPREPVFLLPEYQLIGLIDEQKLISGPQRYESRKNCEVYLLVGLHGSGKTHWTKNHIKANPEKRYNVIGPDSLIEKMTIDGTARKPHHVGKWDKVYDYCISSLSSLEEIATKRRRNFILDQTNAFASAQRRKMKGFGDFKRIAVVCIPTYDDLKKRIELKSGEENSVEIRESSVDKLKANFTLPSTEFGWFEEVQFTDLKDEEAKAEVKKYNSRGKRAVDHSSRKRPRNDYRRDDRRRNDDRRRDYRGFRDRDRRGPPNRFGGGGGGGGYSNNRSGGGGGNYRDDRNRNYERSGGGSGIRYGGGNGSSGGTSWVHGRRGYDDRYRSGGTGGGGAGAGRYENYGGGRNDYRERYDRDRDRNGSTRRNESYRSGSQRDFRAGHRRIEDRDSRDGGFDRTSSKYNSTDDFDKTNSNSKSTNSSNHVTTKWGSNNNQQAGVWSGMSQHPQAQHGYWGYDQSSGYDQQSQQQWNVNSADPRQQQWMAYWQQSGNQQNQQPQYWSQYQTGYQNNDTTGSSK